jgi:NAD(P)-dependent dehydrogenase (short-subunit alcohol dehydrogenase family)
MVPNRGGLIIDTTAWDRDKFLGNVYYDLAKAAVSRMAFGMARDLKPHGVAVVALAPGFVATERL